MTIALPPIPDRLYASIFTMAQYSFPHRDRPEQGETKRRLVETLDSRDPQAIYDLPEALRQHGRAFMRSCSGRLIVGENWTRERAYLLAGQVEVYIADELRKRRAQRGRMAA